MKKFISLILSLIMIFTMAIPAFAAEEEYPTIYVTGAQTNDLYDKDGNRIYPLSDDIDAMQEIKKALKPCLEKLAVGLVTDDYEEYAKEFYNAFVPIYEKVALDKNGEVSNGSHPAHDLYHSLPHKNGGYNEFDYRFWYDWRISPMVAADELKIYIDEVKRVTGESKVNLLGRCYGANVIAAYLAKYEGHALENIDDIAYFSSSALGIGMVGALFSGEFALEADAIENFAEYFIDKENIIEDPFLNTVVVTFLEFINTITVLGVTGDTLVEMVNKFKDVLIPPMLRDTFGSMPSYWSMVPAEYYPVAREFVYGDCEEEYAKHLEKLDAYYEVQLNIVEQMKSLKEKGIDFKIFVKYNFPNYPISKDATLVSDGNTACDLQAFGGEYADYGKILPKSYTDSLTDKTYLSPDMKIDASTCLFPDETWFIKDLHHDWFPYHMNMYVFKVMNNEWTVSESEFSQFMYCEPEMKAVEGLDEDGKNKDTSVNVFIRFLKVIFQIITKILKGEFNFNFKEMLG